MVDDHPLGAVAAAGGSSGSTAKGPPDTSTDFRRRWGGLIWSVGVDLGLDSVTTATAALYFQRFFLTEKEGVFDARRMAISSVWLASKVREGMCRLRDIVNSFESLTGRVEDEKGMSMEVYWALRDELVLHEQALLRAMAYDAELTPAYTFLTEFVWLLNSSPSEKSVIALAWTILNDAFCSEVCVMAAPDRLALGCLLLAVEMGRRVPEMQAQADRVAGRLDRLLREPYLEDFLGLGQNSGADEIDDICRELLAVYEAELSAAPSGTAPSPGVVSRQVVQ